MNHANAVRNQLRDQAQSLGIDPQSLVGPAHFQYMVSSILTPLLIFSVQ